MDPKLQQIAELQAEINRLKAQQQVTQNQPKPKKEPIVKNNIIYAPAGYSGDKLSPIEGLDKLERARAYIKTADRLEAEIEELEKQIVSKRKHAENFRSKAESLLEK